MSDQASNHATKRPRRMAREPQPQEPRDANAEVRAPSETTPSKTAHVLSLLTRPEGATLDQMVEATDWLPHTTRAALTGLKKKGHDVTSVKADGVRTYRVIPVQHDAATSAPATETAADA